VAIQIASALNGMKYVSAERLGPRESYALTARHDFNSVGAQGELTPQFLNEFGGDPANPALTWNESEATIFITVERWMDSFFPGFGLQITPVAGANLVTLQIRTSKSSTRLRSQNVGYGLTQVLPIITLCVAAQKGDTLLLENPETHLHPAGQSAIGELLAKTVSSGVQVIVETHSDHVLNGIRKSIAASVLEPSEAVFNFVTASGVDESTVHHDVQALRSDADGRISDWPAKFFDQFENDLLELP
jgi:predicted ATPase